MTTEEERRRQYSIDPVAFGELVGSVKALETTVADLSADVRSLVAARNVSKGFVIALPFIGGGVGAAIHKYLEEVLK